MCFKYERMLSGRMNQSEELRGNHRKADSAGHRQEKSPNIDPNDRKYMHCARPAAELHRKRKLSGSKNCESLRIYDSQSQSKRSDLKEIYQELILLKSEYRSLKQNYNTLLQEKVAHAEESKVLNEKVETLSGENVKLKKDIERGKIQQELSQQEVHRAKREAGKLLEIQQFRNRKLQETLQEKGNEVDIAEQIISMLKTRMGFEQQDDNTMGAYQNQEPTGQNLTNRFEIEHRRSRQQIQSDLRQRAQEKQNDNRFVLTELSSVRKRLVNGLSDDSLTFSKEKSHIESSKFIGSPRNGCADLLLLEDGQQNECRFYPIAEHAFKKRMQRYVEDDSMVATQSKRQNDTELAETNSPEMAAKKRSNTITGLPKKKRPMKMEQQLPKRCPLEPKRSPNQTKKRKKKSENTSKQTDRLERSSAVEKHTYR